MTRHVHFDNSRFPYANTEDHFVWDPACNLIGEGAFGIVCRAMCIKPRCGGRCVAGDVYAIKVLQKDTIRDERDLDAINQEVDILSRIQSPHCIRIFDSFQSSTAIYLVLEYIEGCDLFAFVCKRGKLTEKETRSITHQLLEALQDLHHRQHIAHRDLKPENVLVRKGSLSIKLADFGCAKFLHDVAASDISGCTLSLTGSTPSSDPGSELVVNTPTGSLKFCAPELLRYMIRHGSRCHVASHDDIRRLDMFAVGVIMYVLLAGVFPFPAKDAPMLLQEIQRGPEFPDECFDGVSEAAKDLCRQLLRAGPKSRPLSAAALQHPWLRLPLPTARRIGCAAATERLTLERAELDALDLALERDRDWPGTRRRSGIGALSEKPHSLPCHPTSPLTQSCRQCVSADDNPVPAVPRVGWLERSSSSEDEYASRA